MVVKTNGQVRARARVRERERELFGGLVIYSLLFTQLNKSINI